MRRHGSLLKKKTTDASAKDVSSNAATFSARGRLLEPLKIFGADMTRLFPSVAPRANEIPCSTTSTCKDLAIQKCCSTRITSWLYNESFVVQTDVAKLVCIIVIQTN
eukprot:m.78992 g.78992  ORF g.78992 m.78992 type:complete len:107 (+) comp12698_c0_seq6:1127-1447(+)